MKFVVVGLGSIGSRHKKNLLNLGHEVVDCHRNDDLEQLIRKEKPEGVFVCTPTSLHLEPATIALRNDCHVFLEKPISHNLEGVDKLLEEAKVKSKLLMVGYQLRFEKNLKKIREQLEKNKLGRIYSARVVAGSYLPDWRPGVDYRENYGARKDLGGGVLLDLSHEIDYVVWLLGKVKKVFGIVKQVPELKIETEAIAEMILEHQSGAISSIHLDYASRDYIRNCQIIGEKGNLNWDFGKLEQSGFDKNQMYVDEVKHFIEVIEGKDKLLITSAEARHVLEIVEVAKESSKKGKVVKL
jgi:predicted dehydrogenase